MSSKNAFGLDIGDTSLKLVWLNERGYVRSFNEIGLAPGVIEKNVIKNKIEAIKGIKKLIATARGAKIKTNLVVACLPEPKTFIKVIEIPAEVKKNEIKDFVAEEIHSYIPLRADEVYVDWQMVSLESGEPARVLVGAVPQKVADSYFDLLSGANLEIRALQIEAAAIANALISEKKNKKIKKEGGQIIVDLGDNRSSLILFDRGTIQFSISLPVAGADVTREIVSKQKISFEAAEKQKIAAGLRAVDSRAYKIIEKNFSIIVDDVSKAVKFYNQQTSRSVGKLLLCGGGALTKNLLQYLGSKTNLKAELGDPFSNIKPQEAQKLQFPNHPILFTTAIGLALEGIKNARL